jgi:tetratricopeptide (TPR) repeat protein
MGPHGRGYLDTPRYWALLAAVSVILCTTPAAGQRSFHFPGEVTGSTERTVGLEGWVRTDSGKAAPQGAIVRVETSEGSVADEQPTNSDGHFELGGLPKRTLRLTVTADGFQPYQQNIDLGHSAGKMIVTINLVPLDKVKQALSSLPSLTDEQAPKQARKEYEKGRRALRETNSKQALEHFQKAVNEYPCYARAQTDLATLLSAQHQVSSAEAALRKALECDPGFLDAYAELGQLFYVEKKFPESEAVLQEGVRRSPGTWQFYYQLASAHYGMKQYQKAEGEYLKAESLTSAVPPDIHVKLANVYFKTSAFDKAYAEMQAYLRAEPNGRFASNVRHVMQKMESDGIARASPSP